MGLLELNKNKSTTWKHLKSAKNGVKTRGKTYHTRKETKHLSQQQPDLFDSIGRLWSNFTFPPCSAEAEEGGPTLFLISAAIVMKACSTLVAFFAEVSRNGIPNWSAYSWFSFHYSGCLLGS